MTLNAMGFEWEKQAASLSTPAFEYHRQLATAAGGFVVDFCGPHADCAKQSGRSSQERWCSEPRRPFDSDLISLRGAREHL